MVRGSNTIEGIENEACFYMVARAFQSGFGGKSFCSTCHTELEREEKLVGLIQGGSYDIYRCPRCSLAQWAPKPRPMKKKRNE